MSVDPEEIVSAFYDFLIRAVDKSFVTKDRRAVYWTKLKDVQQPAIFVRHLGDEDKWSGEGLQSITISLEVWIYCKTNMADTPDVNLNSLVKLVRETVKPSALDERLTLGGLVYHCRIEGKSEYDPGDLDTQGKAVIPVSILVEA